jgi:ribosomal protein L9
MPTTYEIKTLNTVKASKPEKKKYVIYKHSEVAPNIAKSQETKVKFDLDDSKKIFKSISSMMKDKRKKSLKF